MFGLEIELSCECFLRLFNILPHFVSMLECTFNQYLNPKKTFRYIEDGFLVICTHLMHFIYDLAYLYTRSG